MPAKRLLRSVFARALVALGFCLLALGGVNASQRAGLSHAASTAGQPLKASKTSRVSPRTAARRAVPPLDAAFARHGPGTAANLLLSALHPFTQRTGPPASLGRWIQSNGVPGSVAGIAAASPTTDTAPSFYLTHPFGGSVDQASSVALGDVNGDGALDLIVGNNAQQSLVYLNDGAGNFNWPGSTRPFGANPDFIRSVAVADVNGDGALDIVAGNYSSEQGKVYLNDGAGNFNWTGNSRPFGESGGTTTSVAVGDVNGDGAPDLIVGNEWGQSVVYLNDGAGNFNWPGSGRPVGGPTDLTESVAVGDLNGDGALDLVVSVYTYDPGTGNETGGQGLVYLNDGSGNFNWTASTRPFGGSGDWTPSVALADVNGDGGLDIVAGKIGQQSMVYLNDKAGNFNWTGSARPFGGNLDSTLSVAVGDLNGDGALDIVASNSYSSNGASAVYLNDGNGNFKWSGSARPFGGGNATSGSVAVGDLNGDGALDFAVGIYQQQSLVYLNDGAGNFNWPGCVRPFGYGIDLTYSVAVGDVNGDGAPDIIAGKDPGVSIGQSRVYLTDGAGNFNQIRPFGGSNDEIISVAVGDVNGDGALDIVASIYYRQSAVFLNDGAGNFDWGGSARPFGNSAGDDITSVAVGDVNGDGALDIIAGLGGGRSMVYLNDGAGNFDWIGSARPFGGSADGIDSVAAGDVNGDGALDIIAGNGWGQSVVYLNDGAGNFNWPDSARPFGGPTDRVRGVAVGDLNGDGALDIAVADRDGQSAVYLNDGAGNFDWTGSARLFGSGTDQTWSVAIGDVNGDGALDIIAGKRHQQNMVYLNDGAGNFDWPGTLRNRRAFGDSTDQTDSVAVADLNGDGALDIIAGKAQMQSVVYLNKLFSPARIGNTPPRVALAVPQPLANANFAYSDPADRLSTIPISYTLTDREGDPVQSVRATYSLDGGGKWYPAVAASATVTTNLATPGTYVYNWDVFASGFFGQSDDVVLRLQALPSFLSTVRGVPGPYQYPPASATTFPFRVRGSQVQVISGTVPVANAIVYRLPAGQQTGGDLIRDGAGVPFHTDINGYLMGRGQINPGDQLLALAPVMTSTQGYSLYYSNGAPQNIGVNAFTVSGSGVQVITVTAQHPLYLFDLDVSLEWDAHNDSAYLDALTANLKRTSQYLYDFTDGQAALGDVYVYQDMAGWGSSHIAIHANNRLRPFAVIGGIVTAGITDTAPAGVLAFGPGQVTMGSTWNRYGRPGQMLSDDWSIILAHELSHYLFYEDDVYLGLDAQGNLIPVDTCTGSAMGDLYDRPQNTEFIYDQNVWNTNCANTLAKKTIGRTEWNTLNHWYPAAVVPTTTTALSGPSAMPFNLTTITIFDPLTPTATLPDPTFHVNYAGTASASSDARAYLFQSDGTGDWAENLGSPGGGQSSLIARGAKPGDQLCAYDATQRQYGCQRVVFGNDQLRLTYDPSWNPVLQVTPVNSTTLQLTVSNVPTTGLTLNARLFPDGYYATVTTTLGLAGNVYTGMFSLPGSGIAGGNMRVWVDEPGPRRETAMGYSVGGNPGGALGGGQSRGSGGIGQSRGSGGIGQSRGSGGIGQSRGSGGIGQSRGSGGIGQVRSGHAPLLSPDGQMIFFTAVNTDFAPGQLFAIQAAAGLPPLPPGRTQIGVGYSLSASPTATLPVGSISLQYLSNNVPAACADPSTQASCLSLYYYNGTAWHPLPTTVDAEFGEAVAPSQGPGLYALFASKAIALSNLGWNTIAYSAQASQPVTAALASILGRYTVAYNYDSTDSADPWKVYAPGAPGYVDDLQQMRDSQVYWIYATMTTTLYLAPADIQMGHWPPATFYGTVSGSATFTPTAQMTVTATVNGNVCGQALTQLSGGNVVYTIDVDAAQGGANPGCGQTGQAVRFTVGGQAMQNTGVWDDSHVSPVDLAPPSVGQHNVYLPLVQH